LIGDMHATPEPLREALSVFRREGVDMVLCTGDIAGYGNETTRTASLLSGNGCTAILGNHDAWYLDRPPAEQDRRVAAYFRKLPRTWDAAIGGKRLHAVHASPPASLSEGITLLDKDERVIPEVVEYWTWQLRPYGYDVLIVGHTHQVYAQQLGDTMVVNPGSSAFNHTCAILSLPDLAVRIIPLSGKKPRRVWHWGMMSG
jgi:putative phosphoesterase